ncbi:hypothetical protein [Saccharicrinis sp. 156]|uniref:hypothetical protein n=1 Tax=Saccharicrinis sp. 156 TaxID=3417574 RepID=UPI003D32F7DD
MGNKSSINDKLEYSRVAIYNAHDDEIIRARFAPFGFDENRHLANKQLFQESNDLILKNEQENAEWKLASEAFNETLGSSRKKLRRIRQSLKFWYDADTPEAVEMGLYNSKISKYADFKKIAQNFYSVLLSKEEVLAKLVPFGYTAESILADSEEVNSLDQLRNKREQESGDAQYATKERNAKLDELDECVSEMVRLARLIFRDDESQYLEKLGITSRS